MKGTAFFLLLIWMNLTKIPLVKGQTFLSTLGEIEIGEGRTMPQSIPLFGSSSYLFLPANLGYKDAIASLGEAKKLDSESEFASKPDSVLWVATTVNNLSDVEQHLVSYITAAKITQHVLVEGEAVSKKNTGYWLPLRERESWGKFGQLPTLYFTVPPESKVQLLLKVQSVPNEALIPPRLADFHLYGYDFISKNVRDYQLLSVFFIAIILALVVYHFVIFLVVRIDFYLLFALYSFSVGLLISYFKGFLLELFFSGNPVFHYTYLAPFVTLFFVISMFVFMSRYMYLYKQHNKWRVPILGIMAAVSFSIICSAFVDIDRFKVLGGISLFAVTFAFVISIIALVLKLPNSKSFFWGNLVVFLGLSANIVMALQHQNSFQVFNYGDFAFVLQQIVFAVGLAQRISLVVQQRQIAQHALIEQLEKNRQMQGKINQRLEVEVAKRTTAIEEQKEELAHKNAQLENLMAEKDGVMGVVAHDLKSPLNRIQGYLEILRLSSKEQDGVTADIVKQIEKTVENGKDLIRDLLDISSATTVGTKLKYEDLSLGSFFEEIKKNFKKTAEEKQIQLHFTVKEATVKTDGKVLERIVENLLSNAIKFSENGKRVELEAQVIAEHFVIHIKDQGPGIPRAEHDRLFKKFQRLSAKPTGNESSTGLGLAIVKALTEKMQGTISLESAVGVGTTFTVTLPVAPQEAVS